MRPIGAVYLHAIGVVLALLGVGLLHYLIPLSALHWHEVLQHVYFFPIVYAGMMFGWTGGLAAAIGAGLVQLPHIRAAWAPMHSYAVGQAFDFPLFAAAGLLSGILVERERRQREELARTTKQLSDVYQQLQRNFDHMKRAERLYAVGQLAAGLAHEIRNPLASIAGASGILQRNARLEEKHMKVLGVIDKECQRLTALLSNFLDFARPRPPKYQMVDIGPVVQSVMELAVHAVGRSPVTLRKDVQADLPQVECDPELLRQVLLNLIINAIQAMPEGGEVHVSAALHGGKLRLRVRDEGCGIPAENREKIFDPFFTTKESGTGLGLSVVHQIVEQHGGVLTAEANPVKGMTFTAVLPLRHGVTK